MLYNMSVITERSHVYRFIMKKGCKKIGKYTVGPYMAIIRKNYQDGSIDYETEFDDETDIIKSYQALNMCVGEVIGIATNEPKRLIKVSIVEGIETIKKELDE